AARQRELRQEQRLLLDRKTEAEVRNQALDSETAKRLAKVRSGLDLAGFEQAVRQYEGAPWKAEPGADAQRLKQQAEFRALFLNLETLLTEPRNQRLELLRENWPILPAAQLDGKDLPADQ